MRIDLEQALHDIATSVQDDVSAEHLSGRVRHLVGRVRRRRAARSTARGAVGVGTAAAVAVVGVNLAGNRAPDTAPPATTFPEPGPDLGGVQDDVRRLTCGQPAPEPSGAGEGLTLEIDAPHTVAAAAPVAVTGLMRNVGSGTVGLEAGPGVDLEVVAVVDGVVAGTMDSGTSGAGIPVDGRLRPGEATTMTTETRLSGCDDPLVRLPEGDYQLIGRATWVVDGEPVVLVSDPVPLAVGEHTSDGGVEPYRPDVGAGAANDPLFAVAEGVIHGYLADPLVAEGYPICGARLPQESTDLLVLDLHLPAALPTGVRDSATTILTTAEGVTVRPGLETATPGIVFLQDGVVVGGVPRVPEGFWSSPTAFGPDDRFDLRGVLRTELCHDYEITDGVALPPGTYGAVAVASVTLDGDVERDGRSWREPGPVLALSDLVEVTLE